MGFELLETQTKHNRPPQVTLSYMRPKPRGKNKDKPADRDKIKPMLTIVVPTTVCGALKGDKHVLMVGTGNDRGKLVIMAHANNKGAIKPLEHKHFFRWRFGYVPKLGDEIFDQEECSVSMSDDKDRLIIIVKPDLFATA